MRLSFLWNRKKQPSIKEGIDNLPFGISFATFSGIVILCNRAMQGICHSFLQRELQNAEFFWKMIEQSAEKTQDGMYILRLENGEIWMLQRRECPWHGKKSMK